MKGYTIRLLTQDGEMVEWYVSSDDSFTATLWTIAHMGPKQGTFHVWAWAGGAEAIEGDVDKSNKLAINTDDADYIEDWLCQNS